jgi:hypothetical protein
MRKSKPVCCDHKEGSAEYAGVKQIETPKGNGYPVELTAEKTVQVRGTGAATKGTKASSKMG